MAVTRRGYVYGAFVTSLVCVLLVVVAIASDSWVSTGTDTSPPVPLYEKQRSVNVGQLLFTEISSTATADVQVSDSIIHYGLFRGELQLNTFATPTQNTLYLICLSDIGRCAITCKTDQQAREEEVRALAQGLRPNPACTSFTNIDSGVVDPPPVISYAFYVTLLLLLFLQLLFAVVSAGLAIINATKNPTEPIMGLPGCLWCNVVTATLGLAVMMTYGIYCATSGLNQHLAMGYIALDLFTPSPSLGYSYWILLGAILCSLTNVGLLELRRYLLERDPPPPTIKVENHSDGNLFLY